MAMLAQLLTLASLACFVCLQKSPFNVDGFVLVAPPNRRRIASSTTRSFSHHDDSNHSGLHFLGSGKDAIVRIGAVLVAPAYEFHHYYRKSAIYIYDMSLEGEDYIIRGLLLDHPTPFTVNEMSNDSVGESLLADNFLFRGGDKGGDGMILLHNHSEIMGATQITKDIYQGGWDAALAAQNVNSEDFKVFFNHVEFTEQEIENMLEQSEDGDSWKALEVSPDVVLNQHYDRGGAWAKLRNYVAQYKLQNKDNELPA
jgi:hypothetical protein